MNGRIYMIPNTLGESPIEFNFPPDNIRIINSIKFFIVEDVRTARRFLKKINREIDIDSLTFSVLAKHTLESDVPKFLKPAAEGNDIGIISEAGCPGVADPGADAVAIAHRMGLRVIPLIGPSSILLAMMASGMNGQNFAFAGYLPVDKGDSIKSLKKLEERSARENQAQLFIETPYRNQKMLQDIVANLRPGTRLCVACNVTCQDEMIVTKTIAQWRKESLPDLNKRPTIFIVQA